MYSGFLMLSNSANINSLTANSMKISFPNTEFMEWWILDT